MSAPCGVVVVRGCCAPFIAEEHCASTADDCRCDLRHHDIWEPAVCGYPEDEHDEAGHAYAAASEEVYS